MKAVRCPKCNSMNITQRYWVLMGTLIHGFDEEYGPQFEEEENFLDAEKPASPEYFCYECNNYLEEQDLVITNEEVEGDVNG